MPLLKRPNNKPENAPMRPFKIEYRETRDSETQSCVWRGYDADHAMERFIDSMVEDGGYFGPENVLAATKLKTKAKPKQHNAFLFSRSR